MAPRGGSGSGGGGDYPLLKEVAPARRATKSRPATGPTYTSAINDGAVPTMEEGETLYELFRCGTHSGERISP